MPRSFPCTSTRSKIGTPAPAILRAIRKLGLTRLLGTQRSRARDLVVATIAERSLHPSVVLSPNKKVQRTTRHGPPVQSCDTPPAHLVTRTRSGCRFRSPADGKLGPMVQQLTEPTPLQARAMELLEACQWKEAEFERSVVPTI